MICEREHINTYYAPIAEDPASVAILELARKAAKSKMTVLITGETGVGKEIMARFIHQHSHFSQGPFISVNCAAMPENMIEAILFGHEKGAFTSAINTYIGKFEQANNGTLLLDEISELPIGLQAKLLRVLQEREVERLGGRRTIPVNIRIIAATNRDLKQQIVLGHFRKDLFYRLNVIEIKCLALKDRPKDIIPLAQFFIQYHANNNAKIVPILSDKAKKKLTQFSWPGNIRELENTIQRTIAMTDKTIIEEDDICLLESSGDELEHDDEMMNTLKSQSKLQVTEAKLILDVLNKAEGSRSVAAKRLNISPRTLRYKIAKLKTLGLDVP